MQNQRLILLQKYHKQEPNDPFNIYGLALEYRNFDQPKAAEYFNLLLENHESYLPTYYHAAQLFSELGQVDKADTIYNAGIKLAQEQSDALALRELQNAYSNFQFDD